MKLIFEQTPEHIKDLQKKLFFGGRGKFYLIVLILVILISVFNSITESESTSTEPVNYLAVILSWIIPIVIIGFIWYFLFKKIMVLIQFRKIVRV